MYRLYCQPTVRNVTLRFMLEIKSNIFAVQCTKMGLVLELASVNSKWCSSVAWHVRQAASQAVADNL